MHSFPQFSLSTLWWEFASVGTIILERSFMVRRYVPGNNFPWERLSSRVYMYTHMCSKTKTTFLFRTNISHVFIFFLTLINHLKTWEIFDLHKNVFSIFLSILTHFFGFDFTCIYEYISFVANLLLVIFLTFFDLEWQWYYSG